MEGIKVEFVFPEEMLRQLEDRIAQSVLKTIQQNAPTKSERTNLTRKEAAERLRMSLRNLDRYIAEGIIRVSRNKRVVLIPESEIENYLKQSA
jgi:excisionase family DNA binding protein